MPLPFAIGIHDSSPPRMITPEIAKQTAFFPEEVANLLVCLLRSIKLHISETDRIQREDNDSCNEQCCKHGHNHTKCKCLRKSLDTSCAF